MATICNVITGLQIIQKYVDPGESLGGAEHDIIYAVPSSIKVTAEDAKSLEDAGWFREADTYSWATFC